MQQTQQYGLNTDSTTYEYSQYKDRSGERLGDHKPERESAFPFPALTPNTRLGYRILKRGYDIQASLCGLVLLSPVFLVTAIMIYLDDPGPVFFLQDRNELNGKVFRIIKFRSMVLNTPEQRFELETQKELDGPTFKIKNDPRVTRVGRFLRRTSIDELPQLVNILLGQMSVVGPRPLPTYETARLSAMQRQRLLVKPGLTCYWQVSGRNDTSFEEWMEYDFRYIREQGIWTDLKLLLLTFPAVIFGQGVLSIRKTVGCNAGDIYGQQVRKQYGFNTKGVMTAGIRPLFHIGFTIRGDPCICLGILIVLMFNMGGTYG